MEEYINTCGLWLWSEQGSEAWTEIPTVLFATPSKTFHCLMTQFLHLHDRDMNISSSLIKSLYFGDRSWLAPFKCKYTTESPSKSFCTLFQPALKICVHLSGLQNKHATDMQMLDLETCFIPVPCLRKISCCGSWNRKEQGAKKLYWASLGQQRQN